MEIAHGRVSLWLHPARDGEGAPLLVLHALGSDGAEATRALEPGLDVWPGPVYALDFCGHGRSGRVSGGAYYPELMAADADAALARLGPGAWISGAGLGAYVALLVAGARADSVAGAILWPGAGLVGGGVEPDFAAPRRPRRPRRRTADPGIQAEPSTDPVLADPGLDDIRPLDYAQSFAEDARRLLLVEAFEEAPPWWSRARGVAGARVVTGGEATPSAVLALAAAAAAGPRSPG
ncbi:MAG: alpha/beta fold hydrolase [Myxococcota bacterium]